MSKKIKVGMIGFGDRGKSLLEGCVVPAKDVEVVAVCEKYEDRLQKAVEIVEKGEEHTPIATYDFRDILKMPDVDAVIISTSWENHINIAVEAMKAGKYVACEVGGAYSIDDCWQLVRTHEETGSHCMLLENCCYGRDELMMLNMVKQGIFGEVVHCQGGYHHDLRHEVSFGVENRHYRLNNYINRNCENYPTHELGPIAKVLNINRGNRMLSLTSTSSKSAGLHDYIMEKKSDDEVLKNTKFAQGDIVTTVIKCAHGETITLVLDTTLPRPYSRGFTVRGTKGMYTEDNKSIFLDAENHAEFDFKWNEKWGNIEDYREKYDHPLWKHYLDVGISGGHDGMDWLVFRAFFESVKSGQPVPIDVYDMATWMSITALSEESIARGSAPVAIPDFTNGTWINREPIIERKYCLDKICDDRSVEIYPAE